MPMLTPVLLVASLLAGPVSTEIALHAEPAPLHGTLLTPESDTRAAAVIIAGSGPTDRDGNSPIGVTGGVYRQLAEGLAERGIATVRYDKRGIAASTAAATDEASLTFDKFTVAGSYGQSKLDLARGEVNPTLLDKNSSWVGQLRYGLTSWVTLLAEYIHTKAEAQGLIEPGAAISDHDLLQMIFHPGFSTAAAVCAAAAYSRSAKRPSSSLVAATDSWRSTSRC